MWGNVSGVEVSHDVFDAGVLLKSVSREVFAGAGVLKAAMRHLSNHWDVGVDPNATKIKGLGHSHRPTMILGPNARC